MGGRINRSRACLTKQQHAATGLVVGFHTGSAGSWGGLQNEKRLPHTKAACRKDGGLWVGHGILL